MVNQIKEFSNNFLSGSGASAQSCLTSGGKVVGAPCVFPFTYNGVTYTDCTSVDDGQAWCSTATDDDGNHINNFWGYCGYNCLLSQQTTEPTAFTSESSDVTSETSETFPTKPLTTNEVIATTIKKETTEPTASTSGISNTSPPKPTETTNEITIPRESLTTTDEIATNTERDATNDEIGKDTTEAFASTETTTDTTSSVYQTTTDTIKTYHNLSGSSHVSCRRQQNYFSDFVLNNRIIRVMSSVGREELYQGVSSGVFTAVSWTEAASPTACAIHCHQSELCLSFNFDQNVCQLGGVVVRGPAVSSVFLVIANT